MPAKPRNFFTKEKTHHGQPTATETEKTAREEAGEDGDHLLSDWLSSVKPSSAKVYRICIEKYFRYCRLTPEEAKARKLKEREKAERETENEMEAWARNLERKGYTPAYIALALHAVKSFYAHYGLQLAKISPKLNYDKPGKTAFVPTQQELGRMMEVWKDSPRNRFLICGLAESGLAISDFLKLQWDTESPFWGTIKEQVEDPARDIIHARLIRGKTKTPHDNFMGRMCVSILRETGEAEREGPLVKLSARRAKAILEETARKAGLPIEGMRFGPHQLRAYFISMLEGLGDRQDNPAGSMGHYWAGHKPNPIQKAYGASTNTRVEKQAEWYKKWETFLEPKMPSDDSQSA
jgi:integrase